MTNSSQNPRIDLQEVYKRNRIARDILAGFSTAMPTLIEVWQHLNAALTDVTILATELINVRLERAHLAAAALATIHAHRDGEDEPLSYLYDELAVQGYPVRGNE